MRVVVNIHDSIRDPRAVALAARGLLLCVRDINRVLIRQAAAAGKPYKPLYKAIVDGDMVWRREPWAGTIDEFADIATVYARHWCDCDDAVGILCAEKTEGSRRIVGGRAVFQHWTPKIYWRPQANGRFLFHAQVRQPDGSVVDPSRLMGM